MAGSLSGMFLQGGWVMWPLLIFSILTWAVVFERAVVFLSLRPRLIRLTQSIMQALKAGDTQAARQVCHSEKPIVGELFLGAISDSEDRAHAERITDRNRARLTHHLKKNLWILGTIGSASPFIGLLGTVVGIVRAFHDMSSQGAGGFNVVAGGISEALIATAAGLIVAIIALLTYNVFVTATNQTVQSVKLTLEELLDHGLVKNH